MQQSVALSKSNLFQKNICLYDKTLAALDAAVQSDILIIFNQRQEGGEYANLANGDSGVRVCVCVRLASAGMLRQLGVSQRLMWREVVTLLRGSLALINP